MKLRLIRRWKGGNVEHIDLKMDISLLQSSQQITDAINAELATMEGQENLCASHVDGIGVMFNFVVNTKDEGKVAYFIEGPRPDRKGDGYHLRPDIGGAVPKDAIKTPIFVQLLKEVTEELFGAFKISVTYDGRKTLFNLDIDTGTIKKSGTLEFVATTLTDSNVHTNPYSYLTLLANVDFDFTLDEIKTIANDLTPTASFWHQITNHLRSNRSRRQKKDGESNEAYSKLQNDKLNDYRNGLEDFINNLLAQYENEGEGLLHPRSHFVQSGNETLKEAMLRVMNVETVRDFTDLLKAAGCYGERSGFWVLLAEQLANTLTDNDYEKSGPPIIDINDEVFCNGTGNGIAAEVLSTIAHESLRQPSSEVDDGASTSISAAENPYRFFGQLQQKQSMALAATSASATQENVEMPDAAANEARATVNAMQG